MGTNINSAVSAFSNKEAIKTEMLDILVGLYRDRNLTLSSKAKDFILIRTEQLLNYYDVSAEIKVKRFILNNNELSEPCVPLEMFDKVFEDVRTKLSQIFLQLISHDLGRFIEDSLHKE